MASSVGGGMESINPLEYVHLVPSEQHGNAVLVSLCGWEHPVRSPEDQAGKPLCLACIAAQP